MDGAGNLRYRFLIAITWPSATTIVDLASSDFELSRGRARRPGFHSSLRRLRCRRLRRRVPLHGKQQDAPCHFGHDSDLRAFPFPKGTVGRPCPCERLLCGGPECLSSLSASGNFIRHAEVNGGHLMGRGTPERLSKRACSPRSCGEGRVIRWFVRRFDVCDASRQRRGSAIWRFQAAAALTRSTVFSAAHTITPPGPIGLSCSVTRISHRAERGEGDEQPR